PLAPLGFDVRRPTQPCRPPSLLCSLEILLGLFLRAKYEMLPSALLHLLDDLLQIRTHGRDWLTTEFHFVVSTFSHDNVEAAETLVFGREVIAEMSASAFSPLQGRASNHL